MDNSKNCFTFVGQLKVMKDTVTFSVFDLEGNEYELNAEGIYSPEEKMVMYYSDGSGYPGCPAEFEVTKIELLDKVNNQWIELDDEMIKHFSLENSMDELVTKSEEAFFNQEQTQEYLEWN